MNYLAAFVAGAIGLALIVAGINSSPLALFNAITGNGGAGGGQALGAGALAGAGALKNGQLPAPSGGGGTKREQIAAPGTGTVGAALANMGATQ